MRAMAVIQLLVPGLRGRGVERRGAATSAPSLGTFETMIKHKHYSEGGQGVAGISEWRMAFLHERYYVIHARSNGKDYKHFYQADVDFEVNATRRFVE